MVVRPEEVGELNREEQRAKETLEKEIDEYLLDFDGDGVCKFYFKYDKEITKRVRKKIQTIYETAGWKKVEFGGEYIEGEWIEFIK